MVGRRRPFHACKAARALLLSPLIAWATGGRYYLARPPTPVAVDAQKCAICERDYEGDDMAHCAGIFYPTLPGTRVIVSFPKISITLTATV